MAQITQNQFDYLTNLSKSGGGNAVWAQNQLKGVTAPPAAPTNQPATPAPAQSFQVGGQLGASGMAAYNNIPDSQKHTFLTGVGTPQTSGPPAPAQTPAPFGGFTYGSDPTKSHALDTNIAKWNSDPVAKQAEIERSLGIYQGQKARGEDFSAAYNHLTKTLGYNPDAPPPPGSNGQAFTPPPMGSAPQITPMTPGIPAMDMAAIQKYAEEQVARKLADAKLAADQAVRAGQTTAQQQLGALQTQFDRSRETINEDRTLQNAQDERTLSPFAGNDQHKVALRDFARERTDREMQQDLASRQGNINQDLANLENTINEKYKALSDAAPDERNALIQSIKNDERQYELMLHGELRSDVLANAQLTRDQFDQALQTFNANRGVFESDRNFKQNQQQIDFGQNLDTQKFNFQKSQQEWENAFTQGQFDFQKKQQVWENTFKERSFEQDMKEAAASRGLQWASLNQRDKEFIADQEWREKTFKAEQESKNLTQGQITAYDDLLGAYTREGRDPQEALSFLTSPQGKKNALDYGVTEGLYNQLVNDIQSRVPREQKPSKNELEADYISNLDRLTPEQQTAVFENEKETMIRDLGLSGYEKLREQYDLF